ncbi:PilZ domain-containing protein [Coprothermobacteraceae bacterium]|nr:PilZ domain-containing protein [Coprothermobacteraceae bacterium]
MGEKRFPRIGQRVTLVVSSDHGDEYYPSRVEDVTDDLLACSQPMYQGAYVKLFSDVLDVLFLYQGSFYRLPCSLLEQGASDPPVALLRPMAPAYRSDRRNFVRVPWLLACRVLPVRDFPKDNWAYWDVTAADALDATVVDISAGGARIALKQPVAVREKLLLRVTLPEPKATELLLRAIVRRVEKDARDVVQSGVEFVDVSNKEQDALIRAVLHRQRELIRRGFYLSEVSE